MGEFADYALDEALDDYWPGQAERDADYSDVIPSSVIKTPAWHRQQQEKKNGKKAPKRKRSS